MGASVTSASFRQPGTHLVRLLGFAATRAKPTRYRPSINQNEFTVLSTDGDSNLGGVDVDQRSAKPSLPAGP